MTEHDHSSDLPDRLGPEFWDERYRSKSSLWSRNPNPQLIAEASDLSPGRAFDAGSGEGADAIWLADRRWKVTAIDISQVALERAAEHAREAGAEIEARIDWQQHDLFDWSPPQRSYELVSAQYLQLPPDQRAVIFGKLADAVAVGGTLLIVGHHPTDLQTTVPRPPNPERFFTGDDIARQLDGGWEIVTNAAASRTVNDPDGNAVTIHDTVLRAVRRR